MDVSIIWRVRTTAKADYAVRAAVELAAAGDMVTADQIAQAQSIPVNFLENILRDLRRAGLIESRRGQAGGYLLARSADEISIAAVIPEQPATEAELRTLTNQADGLVRLLGAQMAGSERRLDDLTSSAESSLAEIATELHRVEALRPRLEEARSLMQELELRARELRTAWLLRR